MTVRGFFGGLLWSIGMLITVLSGGCSVLWFGWLGLGVITHPSNIKDIGQGLGMGLMFGGIPLVVGLAILFIGKAIKSNGTKSDQRDQ